ncbi:MAG TPA: hypothetical protein VIY48_12165 [Candidatus Paceibacterota bacterium]
MLSQQDRLAVVKKLTRAFYQYRDLPIWLVCKRARVYPTKTNLKFGGAMHYNNTLEYPGKAPSIGKEETFWHELCHWLLRNVLYRPGLIGYQAKLLQYEKLYWVHERICDAFADLMILYRRGITEPHRRINIERWIFEDTRSIGYAEVTAGSMRRIARVRDEALAARRNVDVSEINLLLEWMERYRHQVQFQPMLPTQFVDCHQTSEVFYVDERADSLINEKHWGKKSWRLIHPKEEALLSWMRELKEASCQLALFEEATLHDKQKLQKELERLDKAVLKFQKS